MKNKLIYFLSLLSFVIANGCNSPNEAPETIEQVVSIDSFDSALPHGSSLGEIEMSDEDKLKLAKAVGKKAILITVDSLQYIIKNDSSGW